VGKFNLYYDFVKGGRLIHKAVSVPFAGILTQTRADIFADYPSGQGYYLVPENDPDLKPLRIKWSYPIWMDDMP